MKKKKNRVEELEEENKRLKEQLKEANEVLRLFKNRDHRFQSNCWDKLYKYFEKYRT